MTHRWLIVLPYFPFPTNHGGKLDALNFLEAVRASGIEIACVSTFNPDEAPTADQLERMAQLTRLSWTYQRKTGPRALLKLTLPFQVASRQLQAAQLELIYQAMQSFQPTAVIAMQHYTFFTAESLAARLKLPILMRSQNVESSYFLEQARASSSLVKRLYMQLEARRMALFEHHIYRSSWLRGIGEIALQDVAWHAARTSSRTIWLAPFIQLDSLVQLVSEPSSPPTLLYVGALSMPNNLRGLEWFLKQVWPGVAQALPEVRFQIVGSRPSDEFQRHVSQFERVELHANVPDLTPFYAQASMVINPIFHGSGTNMKNIEAMSKGMSLVTTQFGARGLPWKHGKELLIAESAQMFQAHILLLLNDAAKRNEMGRQARAFAEREFEPKRNIARLVELLP